MCQRYAIRKSRIDFKRVISLIIKYVDIFVTFLNKEKRLGHPAISVGAMSEQHLAVALGLLVSHCTHSTCRSYQLTKPCVRPFGGRSGVAGSHKNVVHSRKVTASQAWMICKRSTPRSRTSSATRSRSARIAARPL